MILQADYPFLRPARRDKLVAGKSNEDLRYRDRGPLGGIFLIGETLLAVIDSFQKFEREGNNYTGHLGSRAIEYFQNNVVTNWARNRFNHGMESLISFIRGD